MNISFDQILGHAVAPIVLISGVGLILLSLNNRYSNAMAKTRSIISELTDTDEQKRQKNLRAQIRFLLKRCNILRLSIAMVVASTVSSSCIILLSILAATVKVNPEGILMSFLFVSCTCIMIANLLLFWDVAISLGALKLEAEYSLASSDKKS